MGPAQMFYGRRQRTELPALPGAYKDINQQEAATARRRARQKEKECYDKHARPLPSLQRGQTVVIQDPSSGKWDKEAVVLSKTDTGRSYHLRLMDGKTTTRNRIHLKPVKLPKNTSFAPMAIEASYDDQDQY